MFGDANAGEAVGEFEEGALIYQLDRRREGLGSTAGKELEGAGGVGREVGLDEDVAVGEELKWDLRAIGVGHEGLSGVERAGVVEVNHLLWVRYPKLLGQREGIQQRSGWRIESNRGGS